MKKKFFLLKLIKVIALSPVLTIAACKMASHKIDVVIKNAEKQKTIFDNIFRLNAFDNLMNHLAYDDKKNNADSYLTQNYEKNVNEFTNKSAFKKWGLVAKEFYESFYTRSKDTFFTKIEILNDFSSEKDFNGSSVRTFSNIVNGVREDKNKDNDNKNGVLERQIGEAIRFKINFKGLDKDFLLTGSVHLNFKVEWDKEKKFYTFLWLYKKDISDLKIDKISEDNT